MKKSPDFKFQIKNKNVGDLSYIFFVITFADSPWQLSPGQYTFAPDTPVPFGNTIKQSVTFITLGIRKLPYPKADIIKQWKKNSFYFEINLPAMKHYLSGYLV